MLYVMPTLSSGTNEDSDCARDTHGYRIRRRNVRSERILDQRPTFFAFNSSEKLLGVEYWIKTVVAASMLSHLGPECVGKASFRSVHNDISASNAGARS